MADLIGFTSISIVSLITIILALKFSSISKVIYIALVVRVLLIIIGHYVIQLPDSTQDAVGQEEEAWLIAQSGFLNLIDHYKGPNPRFHSWLIAFPYSLFGRSILMAQSISLLLGIGCVIMSWKLAYKIWDTNIAKKVAWIIALFPSLVLYSVLVLREVYICFFLLVALIGVVNWTKTNNFKSIIFALLGFASASFFHGGMAVGAMTFILFFGFVSIKRLLILIKNYKINIKVLMSFSFFIIFIFLYVTNKISVPYLNDFNFVTNMEVLIEKTKVSTRGIASYPIWSIANTPTELIYKTPIRGIFFLFSPLPWEVKEYRHLIGMLDAFIYVYLTYLILRNFKTIWRDPTLKLILLILISYIAVFAIGVGNFGTAIRHRSKFTIIIILLAAPLIKKLILFKTRDNISLLRPTK